MNRKFSVTAAATAAALGACSSGDINIQPATTVTDSNNTSIIGGGSGPNDDCGSYVNTGGQTIRGIADADGNCRYDSSFASNIVPLDVDMTLKALPNEQAHIFDSSLSVGRR